jgi:hypothetical protein
MIISLNRKYILIQNTSLITMSQEIAIKNCVNCYELAKLIIQIQPNEEIELRQNLNLITLYNNALRAAKEVPGPVAKKAQKSCVNCNFTSPKIANEFRKPIK